MFTIDRKHFDALRAVASTADAHRGLAGIFCRQDDTGTYLEASDGTRAISVRCSEDATLDTPAHVFNVKRTPKTRKSDGDVLHIEINATSMTVRAEGLGLISIAEPATEHPEFPRDALARLLDDAEKGSPHTGSLELGFNPFLLTDVATALGETRKKPAAPVYVEQPEKHGALRCTFHGVDSKVVRFILMPCRK